MTERLVQEFLLAHQDTPVDELKHYGVKGMKWGVRKDRIGRVRPRATMSRRDFKDSSFTAQVHSESYTNSYNRVYTKAAPKIRKATRQLNKKEKYKGQDFRKPSKLRTEYYNEYSKMVTDQLNAASVFRGRSSNRRFELHFDFDMTKQAQPTATVRRTDTSKGRRQQKREAREVRKLKHADTEIVETDEIRVILDVDDMGYIQDLLVDERTLEAEMKFIEDNNLRHGEAIAADILDSMKELSDDELKHYGVLGMKWGVRRSPAALARAAKKRGDKREWDSTPVRSSSSSGSSKSSSKGSGSSGGSSGSSGSSEGSGGGSGASGSGSSGSSGPGPGMGRLEPTISNQELQARINRIQLEQRYAQLTQKQKTRGQKLVEDIMFESAKRAGTDYGTALLKKGIGSALQASGIKALQNIDVGGKKQKND